MTARDRIVVGVVAAIVLLAGYWFLLLSPKRSESADLKTRVAASEQRLAEAEARAATAQAARRAYASDYAAVARLGKAVPADDDVPALVFQLDRAASRSKVDFRSVKLRSTGASTPPVPQPAPTSGAAGDKPAEGQAAAGQQPATGQPAAGQQGTPATPGVPGTTGAPAAPATALTAAGLPPGAEVGAAGFPTMPFNFVFEGSFFDMASFFDELDGLIDVGKRGVSVSGRLVQVDGFSFTSGRSGFPRVRADVIATTYLAPADEGTTAGATATAPASAPSAPGAGGGSPVPTATAAGAVR